MQMKNILLQGLFFFAAGGLAAQINKEDDVIIHSGFPGLKQFTYRLITTEYQTNENEYFLGLIIDTTYLKFSRTTDSFHYRVTRSRKEREYVPVKSKDTLMKIPLEIEFDKSGKIKELSNWKTFRDLLMVGFSNQARYNLITGSQFEEAKEKYNNEALIRRVVMDDMNYLFSLYGDTFNTEVEYLRLKTIMSPFSGIDYYFQGNLKLEKPLGTKNTVLFTAKNSAGPKEKPLLLEEAKEKNRRLTPEDEPASEIKAVGLNSEQSFQYNSAQRKMMVVTFSDVVSLNLSSHANIRKFELWDVAN